MLSRTTAASRNQNLAVRNESINTKEWKLQVNCSGLTVYPRRTRINHESIPAANMVNCGYSAGSK